jgi:hypothetical protein
VIRRVQVAAAVLLALLGGSIAQQAWAPARAAARHETPRHPAVREDAVPRRLAEAGLYDPAHPGQIDPRNRAFSPQYPLWSDGLTKRRWVSLPAGAAIDATDAYEWQFPAGTRFWKEFSLAGRKVETRLLAKTAAGEWLFGTYVWNAEGTEAVLAPAEGIPGFVELAPGRRHAIPSRTDCTACHGTTRSGPLGFNALQLSTDRDPRAIHGEPLADGMLTLHTLLYEERLADRPAYAEPPRIRTADPATRAVLGYLAANCGPCHDGRGDITAAAPTLRLRDLVTDGDAVARSLADQPTRWQIPGLPDGTSVLVRPGAPDHSALIRRMRSRSPSSQMPPLGTVLRDDAAIEALVRWVEALRADSGASRVSQERSTPETRR